MFSQPSFLRDIYKGLIANWLPVFPASFFVSELGDSLVVQCIYSTHLLSYLLFQIFQTLLASASGKKLFILLLKWYIIAFVISWDAHNTFLRLKGKCARFCSHSDDIVRKQVDKLWLNHSQCQMFLAIFLIRKYIWYIPEMEITHSFSVSDVFLPGISSVSYLNGMS